MKLLKRLKTLPHLKKALKAIQVNQFNWDTMLGVSRADHTAELTGVLYTVKGGIAAMMLNYLTLSTNPDYTVQPYYVKPTYQTELKCILSFKLGKIMRELYSVGKQYGKLKKVGLK
ncbi:DUF2953 domain-containing protein [Piscibacillus salipiscarius]|uniref:DUF2953 domain-containing protein n=1 Tax=Piscibacillus salipiscarius TaxID=299480 RepID=UPI0006D144A3|nr:DUF2953 domain-containing protein [Piscibacillus salipiscarius]